MTKILIIDNDVVYLKCMKTAFKTVGFSAVETVSAPKKVLDTVIKFKPTLILMDLCWPISAEDEYELDELGSGLVGEIRKHRDLRNIPIVIVSRLAEELPCKATRQENCWVAPRSLAFETLLEFLRKEKLV
jgi:CheY-like chemotaxis protein